MNLFFERLRSRRLASAFVLLGTLSAVIVAGSFAAHGVRGQEKQSDSSDATPLKVVDSTVPPNDFVRIARMVGPAVVNINTQTLPKETDNRKQHNFHFRGQPNQQNPDDNQDNEQQGGPADRMMAKTARCRSRSAPALSSIPMATSSPTIT
jgi:serine protease Do